MKVKVNILNTWYIITMSHAAVIMPSFDDDDFNSFRWIIARETHTHRHARANRLWPRLSRTKLWKQKKQAPPGPGQISNPEIVVFIFACLVARITNAGEVCAQLTSFSRPWFRSIQREWWGEGGGEFWFCCYGCFCSWLWLLLFAFVCFCFLMLFFLLRLYLLRKHILLAF